MREYRFLCYTAGILRETYDFQFLNLAGALCAAEFLINADNGGFYEQVRFFEIKDGSHYQLVYRIERAFEPSENYGL